VRATSTALAGTVSQRSGHEETITVVGNDLAHSLCQALGLPPHQGPVDWLDRPDRAHEWPVQPVGAQLCFPEDKGLGFP